MQVLIGIGVKTMRLGDDTKIVADARLKKPILVFYAS